MGDRSNINLVGNTTQGQNVGSGAGIFASKAGVNTLLFKSIGSTGGTIQIIETDNEIYISGTTSISGIQSANNGLNKTGQNVGLGGALTGSTIISGAYTLSLCNGALLNTQCGYQISGVTMFRTAKELSNIAIGYSALTNITSGINNFAIGTNALSCNTTGENNFANGYQALQNNTVGGDNIANGYQALLNNTEGYYNIANGYQALLNNICGYNNTANGNQALMNNTEGYYNIANGIEALLNNSTGNNNIANGECALHSNTIGSNNIAFGSFAGFSNVNGSGNTFIGICSGYGETGSNKLHIANNSGSTLIYGEFDNKRLVVSGTTEIVNSAGCNYLYLGNKDTDGSFRFVVSGSSLVVQTRAATVWTGNKIIAP